MQKLVFCVRSFIENQIIPIEYVNISVDDND